MFVIRCQCSSSKAPCSARPHKYPATDYRVVTCMQLQRFNGAIWDKVKQALPSLAVAP